MDQFLIILVSFLILSLIVFIPHLAIWAVSTLSGIEIAHSFANWLAMVVLISLVSLR